VPRRLFTFFSALSLLLFVACGVAWLWSGIDLVALGDGRMLVAYGGKGADEFVVLHREWHHRPRAAVWRALWTYTALADRHERAGFGYASGTINALVTAPRPADYTRALTFDCTL